MKYCDLDCKHAEFPKDDALDGSRSCRTFVALYCKMKKAYVHKNAPCSAKAGGRGAMAGKGVRKVLGITGRPGLAKAPSEFPDDIAELKKRARKKARGKKSSE